MRPGLSSRLGQVAGLGLVLAALLASCGSGESSEAHVVSRPQFLAKAKTICKKGAEKISKQYAYWAERAHLHANSEEFMDKKAAKIEIPVKVQQLKELRALGLPEVGEKKLEAFLAAMEEGIEKGKKKPSTLRVGDFAFQRAFEMAEGVGLKACFLG
jgi:hypothetical protein